MYGVAFAASSAAAIPFFYRGELLNIGLPIQAFGVIVAAGVLIGAGLVFLLFVGKGVASYGQSVILARIANRIIVSNQRKVFVKLLNENLGFYADRHSTEFITRINAGADSIAQVLNLLINSIGRDLMSLIGLLIVMVVQDPVMSLTALIVAPPACVLPDELIGGDRVFGLTINLYTLRSATNWGVGDLTDLGMLAEWAGGNRAEFVGVNPLHAILDRGADVSPYSPISRLFRNPIYVDVTQVPELAAAPTIRDRLAAPELASQLEALRDSPAVAYEQVMAVKGIVLDALYQVFAERVRGSGDARDQAYGHYVAAHEPQLSRYALWMAIGERQKSFDWRLWPEQLRDYTTEATRNAARELAPRVDFHRWLQFETDRQLGVAAARARASGMRIGLYQDLAIGVSPVGADAWMFPELLVHGVSIGAPPDPYSADGQNWGLPPLDPRALRRTGYRYFIECVRSAFGHSGALRIDHVMGLFRLFWIPEGRSGSAGAYVRYPSHDLLGILALESARHRGLVVGEDLGTVPRGVPEALARWGVLSSRVLLFERDRRGGFKPARSYPALALATANTHDLPTITGFWDERDIELRAAVGLLEGKDAVDRARVVRNDERTALVDRLAAERILPKPVAPQSPAELRGAVHAFLCRTPSRLVGLALDDLAGELEPVNVPGVGQEKHASWTRKMRQPLEIIMASEDVRAALRCEGRERGAAQAVQA